MPTAQRSRPAPTPTLLSSSPHPHNPWRALPVLMAGTFMIVVDFFVVNVTLPSLQSELHAGPTAVEWVVAGYRLTFSILAIIGVAFEGPDRARAIGIYGTVMGVAVTGMIFYGAVRQGYGHAFTVSVVKLAVPLVAVALLSRRLPGRHLRAGRGTRARVAGYSGS